MTPNKGKKDDGECEDKSKCITNGELTLCGCFFVKQDEIETIKSENAKLRGAMDKAIGILLPNSILFKEFELWHIVKDAVEALSPANNEKEEEG